MPPIAFTLCKVLLLILLVYSVTGQPIDNKVAADTSTEKPMRAIQFSYSYMNPVSYRGRTFGVHQWGMMPQITYQTPTNWNFYTVGYIWNNFQTSEVGKIDLGIEKEGRLGKHVNYTVGYEQWFFPSADPGETQPLSNFFEAYLSGEWQDWSPAIGTYYMVGSQQLLQTDLQFSRYIGLLDGATWSLFMEPLAKATLANQSFIINGIYQTTLDRRGRLIPSAPDVRKPYGLVAAELNLPITLQQPRWSLLVDPRLVKPFNTLPGERTRLFFYAVATLTYTLHFANGY
ncbi:MAG: hypothetical protein BGO59_02665 [Spirosoma sp. 48-14]|uniref:hypothetical protein n=2 Tax=unclassified Spirosoma TaxID=2621999 RepID=UPI000967C6F3|nr:hypothetical protein [Spirosoma sp.]OJW80125.1 MAG: hypothetical protein BGO59_02665 [Spirosoma sp. 48-14]